VRLFARLAELAGTREETVEVGEGLRAVEVYQLLAERHPRLTGLGNTVMYAINQEYTSADAPVRGGDELALIPPVSGGTGAL
jgi:molybdopterin converting factor subunit 1